MKRAACVFLGVLAILALAGCASAPIVPDSDFTLVRNGNVVYASLKGMSVQSIAVNQEFKPETEVTRETAVNGVTEGCVFLSVYPDRINVLVVVAASPINPEDPLAHPEEVARGTAVIEGVEVPCSIQRSHDKLMVAFLLFVTPKHNLLVAYQESPMDPRNPDPERFPPMSKPLTREFMDRLVDRARFAFRVDPRALHEHFNPAPAKPQT